MGGGHQNSSYGLGMTGSHVGSGSQGRNGSRKVCVPPLDGISIQSQVCGHQEIELGSLMSVDGSGGAACAVAALTSGKTQAAIADSAAI
jgi:hypothetical protein